MRRGIKRRVEDGVVEAVVVTEEVNAILKQVGPEAYLAGRYELAAKTFERLVTQERCEDFLTVVSYEHI